MKLYKYFRAYLWEKIIRDQKIRFSQPSVLNDPFEMQAIYESLAEDLDVVTRLKDEYDLDTVTNEALAENFAQILGDLGRQIPNDWLLTLAAMSRPMAPLLVNPILDFTTAFVGREITKSLDNGVGVFSLSEKCDDLLMWAHYADSHHGVVIGFENTHPFFDQRNHDDDPFRLLKPVEYSQSRPRVKGLNLDDLVAALTLKSEEWAYEKEWRFLQALSLANEIDENGADTIFLFDYPADSVSEIIIGCRTDNLIRQEIIEYVFSEELYSHVNIFGAVPDN